MRFINQNISNNLTLLSKHKHRPVFSQKDCHGNFAEWLLLFISVFHLFSTPTGVESSCFWCRFFKLWLICFSCSSVFLSLSLSLPNSECRTVASISLKHKIIPIGAINCELVEDYIYAWECVCVWVFVCMARVPAHIQPTHCHTLFLHIPLILSHWWLSIPNNLLKGSWC